MQVKVRQRLWPILHKRNGDGSVFCSMLPNAACMTTPSAQHLVSVEHGDPHDSLKHLLGDRVLVFNALGVTRCKLFPCALLLVDSSDCKLMHSPEREAYDFRKFSCQMCKPGGGT